MTRALFGRRVAVVSVGTRKVEGLRVAFRLVRTLKAEPNAGELTITNLSPESRAATQGRDVVVALECGWDNIEGRAVGLVFRGDVLHASHVRDGANWHTKLRLADGGARFATAQSAFSMGPGAGVGQVLSRLAKDLGVGTGNATEELAKASPTGRLQQYVRGFAAVGRTVTELDRVMKASGREWSIQDGELQVMPEEDAVGEDVLLAPWTGLVGSPEWGEPDKKTGLSRLKAKALLMPELRPGRGVRLVYSGMPGASQRLRVEKVTHVGDTHGAEWTTEVELRAAG